jgi:hypothetical protein
VATALGHGLIEAGSVKQPRSRRYMGIDGPKQDENDDGDIVYDGHHGQATLVFANLRKHIDLKAMARQWR